MEPSVKCWSLESFLPKSVFQHDLAACLLFRGPRGAAFLLAFHLPSLRELLPCFPLRYAHAGGTHWGLGESRQVGQEGQPTEPFVAGAQAQEELPSYCPRLLPLLTPCHTSHLRALLAQAFTHCMNNNYSITCKIIEVAAIIPHFSSFALELRKPHHDNSHICLLNVFLAQGKIGFS